MAHLKRPHLKVQCGRDGCSDDKHFQLEIHTEYECMMDLKFATLC